ncbi:hypothetical protein [Derxia gummosa]|uniref:Uncharacterized protein n=1 Tax=Derxia gummosa DSM 723 TaxID=1121388 RepID=A0A8B6XCI7_9BURK|nr:hypothetical protein [Derxia gummosa]
MIQLLAFRARANHRPFLCELVQVGGVAGCEDVATLDNLFLFTILMGALAIFLPLSSMVSMVRQKLIATVYRAEIISPADLIQQNAPTVKTFLVRL